MHFMFMATVALFVPLNLLKEFRGKSTMAEPLSRTMPKCEGFMGVGIFVDTCM